MTDAPMTLLAASRLELLDPQSLTFAWHDAYLRLTIRERASWLRVGVIRCFPLGKPNTHWSVRDAANKEIGLILEPSQLDRDSQSALKREIERRYVSTSIRRIISISERYGIFEWTIDSDRGPVTFSTRLGKEASFRPSPGRWIIIDTEGRRFEVRDLAALDAQSTTLLAFHL
jgi:hypothetical protein